MEGHDGKDAARLQHGLGCGEPVLDLAKLAVDIDAQCLEAAGGRIDLAGAACRHDRMDDGRQLAGGGDRAGLAGAHDGAGNAARGALLAIFPEDSGKLALVEAHHNVGGRVAALRHAHVERPVEAEGEAAFRLVELGRADAEIKGDAVEADVRPGKGLHFGEHAFMQRQPAFIGVGKPGAAGDGVGIAVDGDHGAGGGLEDGCGVAAVSEGGVEIGAAVGRGQCGDDFAQQHRRMQSLMLEVRRCHQRLPSVSPGGRCAPPSRRLGKPSVLARLRAAVSRSR